MKWQIPVRYLLLGLAALVVVGLAVPAVAQRPPIDPRQAPPGIQRAQSVQAAQLPQLTEEERAQVLSIATGDAQVQKFLNGRPYSVTTVGLWHTRGLKKIGGGVILTLAEPANLDADWPYAEYDQAETSWPPYKQNQRHMAAQNVQQLAVLVDLQKGRVAQITPGPEAKIAPPR